MAQLDLGKVRLTDTELSDKIIQVNGGVRFGKDADGKPGYVVTDAETGADTVIPFKSSGGEVGGNSGLKGKIDISGTNIISYDNGYGGSVTIKTERYLDSPILVADVASISTKLSLNGVGWVFDSSYKNYNVKRRAGVSILAKLKSKEQFIIYPFDTLNITNKDTIKGEYPKVIDETTEMFGYLQNNCDEILAVGCFISQELVVNNSWAKTYLGNPDYAQSYFEYELILK